MSKLFSSAPNFKPDADIKYCLATLEGVASDLASLTKGGRNAELNKAAVRAGSLHHYDAFTRDQAYGALQSACITNGLIQDDGFSSFDATFNSGWNHGLASPYTIPQQSGRSARPSRAALAPVPLQPQPNDGKNPWDATISAVWARTIPLSGTPAETYLLGRGCLAPVNADLRYLPPQKDGDDPALVARVTDFLTGDPLTLHSTFLLPDGSGKAPRGRKLAYGYRKKGGVIRLTEDAEVTNGLGLAEGIETALSVMAMGWRPVWAAIDAGNMGSLPLPWGVEALAIFADHDETGAGLEAAQRLRSAWVGHGRECRIVMPREAGKDWNDVLRGSNGR